MVPRPSLLFAAILAVIASLSLAAAPAFAADNGYSDAEGPPGPQNLNLEATDPLASFRQLQFRTNWNTSRWQSDTETTDYEFRGIFPYRAWSRPNIMRFILPFTETPEGPANQSALKDVEVANLAIWEQCWGRYGFGLSAKVATNDTFDRSNASLGPAEAFTVKPNKNFQWGLFNENFLTGTPRFSSLQPLLTYSMGSWDIGASAMVYTFDWEAHRLTSAPIGVQIGKVFDLGNQPMRAFTEAEYNFKDIPNASKFRILLGLSLLMTR